MAEKIPLKITRDANGVPLGAGEFGPTDTMPQSRITNLTTDISGKVGISGNETIGGTKTFSSAPVISPLTGILKGNGASAVTAAAAGTDYADPKGILGSTGGNVMRKAMFAITSRTGTGAGLTLNTTTAGGVVTSAVVNAGGSGYLVGDAFLISGGDTTALGVVATVSGTAVLTVTIAYGGASGYTNGTGVATSTAASVSVKGWTSAGYSFNAAGMVSAVESAPVQKNKSVTYNGSGGALSPAMTYALSAGGGQLSITLAETAASLIAATVGYNTGGTTVTVNGAVTGGQLVLPLFNSATGVPFDLTGMAAGKTIHLHCAWMAGSAA